MARSTKPAAGTPANATPNATPELPPAAGAETPLPEAAPLPEPAPPEPPAGIPRPTDAASMRAAFVTLVLQENLDDRTNRVARAVQAGDVSVVELSDRIQSHPRASEDLGLGARAVADYAQRN